MPSQNLPQPNVPNQLQRTDDATAGGTPATNQAPTIDQPADNTTPIAAATAIPAAQATVQADSVTPKPSLSGTQPTSPTPTPTSALPATPTPGSLSRENPAGPPPSKPGLVPQRSLDQPLELKPDQEVSGGQSQQVNSGPAQLTSKPATNQAAANEDFKPPVADNKQTVDLSGKLPMGMKMPPNPVLHSSSQPIPASATINPTPATSSSVPAIPAPAEAAPPSTAKPPEPEAAAANNKKGFKLFKNIPKSAKVILGILLGLLALLLVLSLLRNRQPSSSNSEDTAQPAAQQEPAETINLTYWGLWEDSEVLTEVLTDFEAQENIHVDYRKQSHRDYRERLEQAIASGNGPDVFRFHVTWTAMLADQLAPMPSSVMTSSEYQQTFYPAAYDGLQLDGQIVGIPLMYDGLALFYNAEILRTAAISPPTTWSELRTAANKLTVPSNASERSKDSITRGGLAIGNASNVEHFADILALLILQNGGSPLDPSTQYVTDALTFYTNFIKKDQVWSDRLPSSTIAFARGEAAMMFAPSWRAFEIKNLNPELDFAVAPVPQLSSEQNIAWASFWAEGVNKSSKKQAAAWKLLQYLSSAEVLQKLYTDASAVRPFGEIFSRRDLSGQLSSDQLVGAYVKDADYAQTFPMASFTHDNGINDQLIQYYATAINQVLTGEEASSALNKIQSGVNQTLNKYNY